MEKCKHFVNLAFNSSVCNLKCDYCYVVKRESKMYEWPHSPEHIAECLSPKRLGGISLLNFCGEGETMLQKELFELCERLLKMGHYVQIVTNCTLSNKIDQFLTLPKELLERLFIKASFHYLELKKQNLLDVFIGNVKKIIKSPASISVELGAYDGYIPYLDEIKKLSIKEFGALPHITVLRDDNIKSRPILSDLPIEEYRKIWSQFDSDLFESRFFSWGKSRRFSFCYAGLYTGCVQIDSGDFIPCFLDNPPYHKNIYENVSENFFEKPFGCGCPEAHCRVSHAFLAFGDIPNCKFKTYRYMRDRQVYRGGGVAKRASAFVFRCKVGGYKRACK